MSITTGLTIEDYEKLPDALALYHELVDGELIDVSGNTPIHNGLRDALVAMLWPYVREKQLGKVFSEQDTISKVTHTVQISASFGTTSYISSTRSAVSRSLCRTRQLRSHLTMTRRML